MAPSVKAALLTNVIREAVRREAADILLTFGCVPILKTHDGLVRLDQIAPLSDPDLHGLVDIVVPSAKQEALERDRQIDLAYAEGEARFRVNVFYQRGHLSIVMRYVRNTIRSIDDLGLPELLKDLVGNDNGLILMVGPTGSGKSTSLAAMIDHINRTAEKHIITIEDPIEYVYTNNKSVIEQRELGSDAAGFPAALRAALREAPDVLLLGEMRDLESVAAAITVAETGHLVFSTVHANNAPGTIDRIIDIFPAGYKEQVRIQLADVLIGVFNQRLVPRADGNGSVIILEAMLANSAVRSSIRSGKTDQLPTIIQTSSNEGMYLLDDLLVRSVRQGDISQESALEFANDRAGMKKALAAL